MSRFPAKINVLLFRFLGLVHTFLFQCFKIYSNMENFNVEVEQLRCIFKYNNYPVNMIVQSIQKLLDKLYFSKHLVPTVPKMGLLIVLPFLGKFSMKMMPRLYKSFSKTLSQCNIKVIF